VITKNPRLFCETESVDVQRVRETSVNLYVEHAQDAGELLERVASLFNFERSSVSEPA
jgi:hypothetical protein